MKKQDLTKIQILELAANEKIPLGKHTLDKYVSWGLLRGETISLGHRGTLPSTYHRAMENIRLIHRFKSPPFCFKVQDIIFILCWKGLPIRTHILMKGLQKYQDSIRIRFNKAKTNMQDVELLKIHFADLAKDELRYQFTSPSGGTLKAKARELLDIRTAEAVELMVKVESIFNGIFMANGVTISLIANLINDPDLEEKEEGLALQQLFSNHTLFKFDTWMETTVFIDTANEEVLENIIILIRKYWAVLNTPSHMNSFLGKEIWKLFDHSIFIANPAGCKLLLYMLMASGQAPTIIKWLNKPIIFEAWESICEQVTLPEGGD